MLTPEYLSKIEFNKVVELYNNLNVSITADIIRRIVNSGEITSSTKKQIEKIIETNGKEVFDQTLEKTSELTAERKHELKKIFENMAKKDIQGYKELYYYRNKPFLLSERQYKLLNHGYLQTDKTLRNFTNTIAFQSSQTYVEAVDLLYSQVLSGAIDYNTAMKSAVQTLADKGITLKDKLNRNVQLEVAVRRNIMTGIHKTASTINEDIEEYLGCDGYEVTAHIGARPTHAAAQGKQYAKNHRTKISKNYPLWKDVADLWQENNCRHSYFGIILGVSEPQYTSKELREMKNKEVVINGKKIKYYEATQKQRQIENSIRHQKRKIQTLEQANQDTSSEKSKLRELQRKYSTFCNETGIEKDYNRTRIANYR